MVVASVLASHSPARRRLIRLLQEVNFGWHENLSVRGGQPVFDPAPTVVRQVKFGGDNLPRSESRLADFNLKQPVGELFAHLDRIGDGVILRLEVRHGLPFAMTLEEPIA